MSVRGLIDSNGARIPLSDAMAGKGYFPWPLPLTRAIARGFRGEDHYGETDVLSATTLIAPPQIRQLSLRHDLYVEPLDSLWSTYGTLMHSLLEGESDDSALTEEKLVYDFEGQKIAGTVDRFCNDEGQDWKVTSSYSVKLMLQGGVLKEKPDFYWQAQIYKYLLYKVKGVKALKWNLVLIARDWNERRDGAKVAPVEVVPVPLLPIAEIERYIRERVALHTGAAMCADADLPECTPAETWYGKRCERYCPVAPVCHQYGA